MVKDAFVDPQLTRQQLLSSANSINIGRLLPQMAYYAHASLELFRRDGRPPNFIVPAGNLGNVAACLWARKVGLPIGEVILATNANLTVTSFLRTGDWQPRPSVATLASAMDVGNPSNMERLRWLFPELGQLREQFSAMAVSDDEVRRRSVVTIGITARHGARTRPPPPTSTGSFPPRDRRNGGSWWLRRTLQNSMT
jgi:threonine synthase